MKKLKLLLPFVSICGLVLNSCDLFSSLSDGEEVENESFQEGFSNIDDSPNCDSTSLELKRIDEKTIFNENAIITNRGDDSGTLKEMYLDISTKVSIKNYSNNVTYTKKLPVPTHKVSNVDQFADALDYHAFYYDGATFEVELSNNYSSPNKNEINAAFFKSKLCPGVVGLNYVYDNCSKKYLIQMLFNENANSYTAWEVYSCKRTTVPYSYPSSTNRSNSFNSFAYLSNSKGEIDVYNSEQVLYALENNYIPVPFSGSPAETILNKAKDILRKIIKPSMTELDKITAIYTYITANNLYDHGSDMAAAFIIDEEKYPDYVASNFRGFFAEGCLIDGQSVCHGYAKGFNILANMEGITSIKVSSRYKDSNMNTFASNVYSLDDPEIPGTYSNHGYSYVLNKDDNKYYIVDPTYAWAGIKSVNGSSQTSLRRPGIMKTFSDWSKVYKDVADLYHTSIGMGSTSLKWENYFKIGDSITPSINSISNLKTFLNSLISYMANYSDANYKTSTSCYTINLSVKELDDAVKTNPSYISENDAIIRQQINEQISSISKTSTDWIYYYAYSNSDTGLVIFLLF